MSTHPNPVIGEDLAAVAARLGPMLDALQGKAVLITGGAGFLLSYVVDLIAHLNDTRFAAKARVTVLDNMTTGLPARLAHLGGRDDVRLVKHDVLDPYADDTRFFSYRRATHRGEADYGRQIALIGLAD